MDSFEELGLGAELVAALASEGAEEPTPFQVAAIPVIRRGNNLMGKAGPGAGTLIAYGAALLERLEPGAGATRALILTHSSGSAQELAEALARLAAATGHQVAAAGSPWVLPERADVLFGTPTDLLAWIRDGKLDPKTVDSVVIDQAAAHQRAAGLEEIESLLEFVPKDGQRVVLTLPSTPEVESLVERHARRAVQIPAEAAEAAGGGGPKRGEVRYRIVEEPREEGALRLVSELLGEARHCCLFFASEDRAADVGDYLTLHGYAAGMPGDPSTPVWLAVRELDARAALGALPQAGIVPVSYDAPAGPDALDRRHGGGRGGVIVVLPREVPHMRDVARRTGYRVVPFPPPAPTAGRSDLDALLRRLEGLASAVDLAPWLIALEPLLARMGAAEVAAAAVALLRERAPGEGAAAPQPAAAAPQPRTKVAAPPPPPSPKPSKSSRETAPNPGAMARLYISIGERDNAGARELMGAITGESGVAGSQIGKIDVRETFSIVEVDETVAERVIRSLNGVTVRGRSVRADFDRGASRDRPAREERPRGPRPDGPKRDGPKREGPPRDGLKRDGPPRRDAAPRRDGPKREGPKRDGPKRDGPPRRDDRRPPGGGGPRPDRPGKPPRGGGGPRGKPARGPGKGPGKGPPRRGPRDDR